MPAPIDYRLNVRDPFESALSGLKLGSAVRQIGLQEQQMQEQARQKAEQERMLAQLAMNPNSTADDYSRATLLFPGMKDQLKQSWDLHSEQQKQSSIKEIQSVYSALTTDNPDVAVDILERRAEALANSNGRQDQMDAARSIGWK